MADNNGYHLTNFIVELKTGLPAGAGKNEYLVKL